MLNKKEQYIKGIEDCSVKLNKCVHISDKIKRLLGVNTVEFEQESEQEQELELHNKKCSL